MVQSLPVPTSRSLDEQALDRAVRFLQRTPLRTSEWLVELAREFLEAMNASHAKGRTDEIEGWREENEAVRVELNAEPFTIAFADDTAEAHDTEPAPTRCVPRYCGAPDCVCAAAAEDLTGPMTAPPDALPCGCIGMQACNVCAGDGGEVDEHGASKSKIDADAWLADEVTTDGG